MKICLNEVHKCFDDECEKKRMLLTAFVIAGINVLLVAAVHDCNRRFAFEETLDVLIVIELVVARRCLRGRLAVVVFVMGRDLTEHYTVVFLQQGIA